MANRIDIELTSARDDEFTWRAAGARQPRGSVPSSLLPPAAKVGDVLRAEVEVEIDGITVVSVLPPKGKDAPRDRIEYLGPARQAPAVTTTLAGRGDRRGRPEGRREGRPERRPQGEDGRRSEGRGPRREGGRAQAVRGREGDGGRPSARREPPARRGPARFEPGTAHKDELFATLTPEQRPIAERLAIGGLPAVRKAIAEEQQRARQEKRPVLSGEPIVALAEQLLPEVRAAVWLDRAEAAVGRADEITLRDLRTTVVGASPRDEAGRELERQLREALERRVTKLRAEWESHITQAMEDGRVLQALRLSAKPPEPTARFPGGLAARMAELAGEAMTEETAPERWLSLLQAALESPVRRQVKPAGLPKDPSGEVERQARLASSRIPALARLLGMPIPPPPRAGATDRRPTRRPRPQAATPKPAAGSSPPDAVSPSEARSDETPGATPPTAEQPAREALPDEGAVPETAEEAAPEGAAEAARLGPEEGASAEEAGSEAVAGEEVGEAFDEAQSS